MCDSNDKQLRGYQASSNSSSGGIDFGEIPDAWTEVDEAAGGSINPPLSDIESRSDEDNARTPTRNHEPNLNEEPGDDSESSSQGRTDFKKRLYQLEQLLHAVDWDDRDRLYFWGSPFLSKVVELMSDHLGISKGKVYEAAVLMFYRNCFSGGAKLSDMCLMLDSATLQNQELAIEISALEDVANLAMQAEASPLNQIPPEIEA